MAANIRLKIDGIETEVPEGTNLIDAAEAAGVHIPNLCYLKGMKGIGACRLCLVEIEGMKAPLTACTTKAKEGMSVITRTEKVEETRKFVIDLILSMHPLDCMTCTKAGVCRLQSYSYDMGIKESSFSRKKMGYAPDEANPFIKRDPEYCILCGRCVRVCKEQGTKVLEFMGRGVGSKVITADDKPLQESGCTFCGSCVDVCPVNALLEADRWRKGREWDYAKADSHCMLCGMSCAITASSKDGRLVKINAANPAGSQAERFICALGRFGFDSLEAGRRVTAPMKRVEGKLVEISWQEAAHIAAEALKEAGSDAGFVSTAGIVNEDALMMKRFSKEVVGSSNAASTASIYGTAETLAPSHAELETADLFVLVGIDPNQWTRNLAALGAAVMKKVSGGAKLIVISSGDNSLASAAAVNIRGDEAQALKAIVRGLNEKGINGNKELAKKVAGAELDEETRQAAELYAGAKEPVILTTPALYKAASNLDLLKGKAVSVPFEANAKGVMLMGLDSEGKPYSEIIKGNGLKVLYAVGELPLQGRPAADFVIAQCSYMTKLANEADLVLPAAAALETEGTLVDSLGRLKKVSAVAGLKGEAKSHSDVFTEIAKVMGHKLKAITGTEIKKIVTKAKPKAELNPFAREEGLETDPSQVLDKINAPVIECSRLLWLKEAAVNKVTTA